MKKILFAWIGNNDLLAASNDGMAGLGPICQAATTREFAEAVLLSNYPREKSGNYCDWLSKRVDIPVKLRAASLEDPTDFRSIYDHAKKEVRAFLDSHKTSVELTFHLSPGTPSMATIWVILANSIFTATLIQTSPERGLKDVELPFDLAVDYLPDLIKRRDEGIGRLFERSDSESHEFSGIIHRSGIMKRLVARAKTVAPHYLPVLIQGDSGTGKELLAEAIHRASLFKGQFVAVNCGAIPSELIESELFGHKKGAFTGATSDKIGFIKAATGGTLFLDEVGELPLSAQVKLLRVLQEGTYIPVGSTVSEKTDARIIAATNRNLIVEISAGRFRDDLFHRLAVAILSIPPLREREGDLGLLIDHFLAKANDRLTRGVESPSKRLTAGAKSHLLHHPWPGNVRELQNTLLRTVLWSSSDIIDDHEVDEALLQFPRRNETSDILDKQLGEGFELEDIMSKVAKHYLERAMKATAGNKSKTSKLLGFNHYQTLDNWLKKYAVSETVGTEE